MKQETRERNEVQLPIRSCRSPQNRVYVVVPSRSICSEGEGDVPSDAVFWLLIVLLSLIGLLVVIGLALEVFEGGAPLPMPSPRR
ncbi:MAG: hypothetical protein M3518_09330 [Actinomycetota bacterium]|nr:hypothetical protein [Actinomycetota bacterium]